MQRVAQATGAAVQTTVNGLDPRVLGSCRHFEEVQVRPRLYRRMGLQIGRRVQRESYRRNAGEGRDGGCSPSDAPCPHKRCFSSGGGLV